MINPETISPGELLTYVVCEEISNKRAERVLSSILSYDFDIILTGSSWHGQQDERVAKIVNSIYETLAKHYYDLYGKPLKSAITAESMFEFQVSNNCTRIKIPRALKVLVDGMEHFQTDRSKLIYITIVGLFVTFGIGYVVHLHHKDKFLIYEDRKDERQKWYDTVNDSRGRVIKNDRTTKVLVAGMEDDDKLTFPVTSSEYTKPELKSIDIEIDKEPMTTTETVRLVSLTETENGDYSVVLSIEGNQDLHGKSATLLLSHSKVETVRKAMRNKKEMVCKIEYRKSINRIDRIKIVDID